MTQGVIPTPTLSARLAGIVQGLSQDSAGLIDRVLEVMKADLADYRSIAGSSTYDDVRDSVTLHVQAWYRALLSGEAISEETLNAAASFGVRRVHQEISLGDFLQAFRVGSREVWLTLLEAVQDQRELHEEVLFKVSPYLLYHFDKVSQAVAQAYATEQHQLARWQDNLRHELCSLIFQHPDNQDAFLQLARALGLDASAMHIALACDSALDQSQAARIDALTAAAAASLNLEARQLLPVFYRGRLLLWVPLPHGDPPANHDRLVADRVAALFSAQGESGSVGVGLPGLGARGWSTSARQALATLDIGAKLLPTQRVYLYSDVMMEDLLSDAPDNVTRYFEAMLERLWPEPNMLETLEAFFEHGQHRKVVAAALDIHPNTLKYRLDRIEAILGMRLDQPGSLSKLHIALRLRRLSV